MEAIIVCGAALVVIALAVFAIKSNQTAAERIMDGQQGGGSAGDEGVSDKGQAQS